MAVCLLYNVRYEGSQLMKVGPDYLADLGNWVDVLFIFFGYANIYTLFFAEEMLKFYSKVIFVLTTFLSIAKTFKTMKS